MNFLDQLILEQSQLQEKIDNLINFQSSIAFNELSEFQSMATNSQLDHMTAYNNVLKSRIEDLNKNNQSKFIFTFSEALYYLKQGRAVRRLSWEQTGFMVFKQIPANIKSEIVPIMQSLPQEAKDIIMHSTKKEVRYNNQLLLFNEFTTIADNYIPSADDLFAEDWELVTDRK